MEYGLDAAGAKRSFDAAIREDPTREAGVFRDVVTGEHVCVQGGHSFVEVSWMDLPENKVGGKARVWDMVTHYHPDRGLIIDRIPSGSDFDVITYNQRAGLAPRGSVQSTIVWTDAKSRIRFETQFGYTPGAPRSYWTRYRVDDGTTRVASFAQPPSGAGLPSIERGWIPGSLIPPHPYPVAM